MAYTRQKIRLALIALLIISSFITGFTYRDANAGGPAMAGIGAVTTRLLSAIAGPTKAPTPDLSPVDTYWNVINYLDTHYYGEKPKPKELTYAAIRGMLSTLGDRYTRFMDPVESKEMQEETRGDFEGIGAELGEKEGRIFIKKTLDNSPALRANLKSQDVILKVDEKLIQGMDILDVVKLIRGPRGTEVKLLIKREDTPEPFDVKITRDTIQFAIMESRMEDTVNKIGYVALRQFNEKSDQQVYEALNDLENQGARGVVFDLRGNPGGLLEAAVAIGSRFIPDGDVVVIQNKGGRRSAIPVDSSKFLKMRMPLAVLVDQNTASASEIVAGAIQDHKAGVLIGSESFGKGLVQSIIPLEDGCAVAVTTAKYLTPNGHDVTPTDKIKPDIAIEPSDDDLKSNNDVQLKRAVQYLKEKLGGTATAENVAAGKG